MNEIAEFDTSDIKQLLDELVTACERKIYNFRSKIRPEKISKNRKIVKELNNSTALDQPIEIEQEFLILEEDVNTSKYNDCINIKSVFAS
jgi:hypothetical protein